MNLAPTSAWFCPPLVPARSGTKQLTLRNVPISEMGLSCADLRQMHCARVKLHLPAPTTDDRFTGRFGKSDRKYCAGCTATSD